MIIMSNYMWHIFRINIFKFLVLYILQQLLEILNNQSLNKMFKLVSFESCKIVSLTSDYSTFAFLLNDSFKQYVCLIHVSFLFSISVLLVSWYLWRLEEGIRFPRIRVRNSCVHFKMDAWKWNINAWEEHLILLNS